MEKDRRSGVRMPLRVTATITNDSNQPYGHLKTRNIGSTGIFIETDDADAWFSENGIFLVNLIDSGRGGSTGVMRMQIIYRETDGLGLQLADKFTSLRPFISRAVQRRWQSMGISAETRASL